MKNSTFEVICEEPNNGKNTISSIDFVVIEDKRNTVISLTFNEPNEENMVIINLSLNAWKHISKEINELLEEEDF
jgi:hypothetical protein